MIYAEYILTDEGYDDPTTDPVEHLESIEGRDNLTQRFVHNGITGYPTGHVWLREGVGKCVAAFDDVPDDGGTAVAVEDVVARLISDYGYPAGTTLGDDGRPVVPES